MVALVVGATLVIDLVDGSFGAAVRICISHVVVPKSYPPRGTFLLDGLRSVSPTPFAFTGINSGMQ